MMDFDKLKKAAKETLKIMSAKDEPSVEDELEDDFPDVKSEPKEKIDNEDVMGSTQRIDLKTIFERFRTKVEEGVPAREAPPKTESASAVSLSDASEAMDEIAKTVDEIDKRTEEITLAADEHNEKLSASIDTLQTGIETSIDEIKSELAAIHKLVENADVDTHDSFNSVTAKLNNSEKRAEKLINSLSGVSKLNDSIFDLKNSQMNMRNTLADLEESFYSLKRKMTTGILIISVIAAVIAILEIINLLS
ncbi:MAG: hypothetical protein IJH37_09085 [Clostridia bacterium]|nr:hypothetical protein [Clostridia bacterium]